MTEQKLRERISSYMLGEDEDDLKRLAEEVKDMPHVGVVIGKFAGFDVDETEFARSAKLLRQTRIDRDVEKTRIIIKDGSVSARTFLFVNAIMQIRRMAFDGRKWYVQADKRSAFAPVSVSEIPEKERVLCFWIKVLGGV